MTAKKHRLAGNQAAESRGADTGNDTPPARLHIPDTRTGTRAGVRP